MPRRIKGEVPNGFGARLAALRKQTGISQTALAKEVGVSQRMMAYYESPTAFAPASLLPAKSAFAIHRSKSIHRTLRSTLTVPSQSIPPA